MVLLVLLFGISLILIVVFVIDRATAWRVYEGGEIQGTLVSGDTVAPPTRWWNHLYLARWGWKRVAVFKVQQKPVSSILSYVGYYDFRGRARVTRKPIFCQFFRVRVGRESCTFFCGKRFGK